MASTPFDVGAPATKLVFTQTASSVVPDGGNLPPIVVSVEDAAGNVVKDDNTTQVTLKLAIPAGGLGGNFYGVITEPVQDGVAVFNKLYIQQVALNSQASTLFNLVATSPNRTNLATDTTSFTVGPAAPAAFKITQGGTQPNLQAGQMLDPVTIQARRCRRQRDHQQPPDERVVRHPAQRQRLRRARRTRSSRSISSSATTPQSQLYDTMPLENGTATFSNIAITKPNIGYTYAIGTTDLNLPSVRSAAPFTVTTGLVDHVVFLSNPLQTYYNHILAAGGGVGPCFRSHSRIPRTTSSPATRRRSSR